MGIDVSLVAGAAVGIGEQARPPVASGAHARQQAHATSKPVTIPASYQGQNPALTYEWCVFPQVTPNMVWEILRVGVTGNDPFTALAAVTALLVRVSTIPQDSSQEPATFGDLIAVIASVPNVAFPPIRAVYARGNERIAICFKGLAVGQQIQASMDVIEHPLAAYLASLTS